MWTKALLSLVLRHTPLQRGARRYRVGGMPTLESMALCSRGCCLCSGLCSRKSFGAEHQLQLQSCAPLRRKQGQIVIFQENTYWSGPSASLLCLPARAWLLLLPQPCLLAAAAVLPSLAAGPTAERALHVAVALRPEASHTFSVVLVLENTCLLCEMCQQPCEFCSVSGEIWC